MELWAEGSMGRDAADRKFLFSSSISNDLLTLHSMGGVFCTSQQTSVTYTLLCTNWPSTEVLQPRVHFFFYFYSVYLQYYFNYWRVKLP